MDTKLDLTKRTNGCYDIGWFVNGRRQWNSTELVGTPVRLSNALAVSASTVQSGADNGGEQPALPSSQVEPIRASALPRVHLRPHGQSTFVRRALSRGPSLSEEQADVSERKKELDGNAHKNARPYVPRREFVDPTKHQE